MLKLVAISQATTEINRGAESTPPGIECFKSPRSDRVNNHQVQIQHKFEGEAACRAGAKTITETKRAKRGCKFLKSWLRKIFVFQTK